MAERYQSGTWVMNAGQNDINLEVKDKKHMVAPTEKYVQ